MRKLMVNRQLPNMPKDYITRLVFDPRHKSLIGLRNSELVIGVLTFRVCEKEGDLLPFIEVRLLLLTYNTFFHFLLLLGP